MKSKLFRLFFLLTLLVGIVFVSNASAVVSWDLTNSVLVIYGEDAMTDYASSSSVPWYNNRTSIKKIVISDGVTSIGKNAFYGCSSLTSISISDSVTSIGENAFSGCSSLTSITISDSVTSIGENAFAGCFSLVSINIPSDVTSIGKAAFINCTSLAKVTFSNNATSIGAFAFYDCSSLESINIPNSVTFIGECAFAYCSSLTSINIPSSVTSIAADTFARCTALVSITIPNSITSIGEDAFSGCSSLTSINIPNSVTSIGKKVFSDCSSLTSINIPDSVTSIGEFAFSRCSSLTSISIPSSMTFIERYMFEDCSSLTCINISDSVTSIGEGTFSGCSSLTSIFLPDSITSIGEVTFFRCSSLTSISLPNSLTFIERYMFEDCSSLISINIPDSVTSIGEGAFCGCSSLTSITIPDSVTDIYEYVFWGCRSLAHLTIDDIATLEVFLKHTNCDVIQDDEYGCITIFDNLKSLDVRNATSIDSKMFSDFINLEEISLPFIGASATATGSAAAVFGYVFGTNTSGEYVEADQYYSSTSYATYRIPTSLKTVHITNATQIPYGAFDGCSGIDYISLNEGVTTISQNAFADCGFLSLYMPKSVTRIGTGAFSGTDIEMMYVSMNSYCHTYAVNNNIPYTFYDYFPVTDMALTENSVTMDEGKTHTLTAVITPENATYPGVTWESSDTSVATVAADGTVTAVNRGKATITATTDEGGFTDSCEITVLRRVTSVALDYSTVYVGVGNAKILTATVSPALASDPSVIWTSSDTNVASVNGGIVTAVGYGTAVITATTNDGGFTAQCVVTTTTPVTGVALNTAKITATVGHSQTLTAIITPTDAYDKTVTWKSSDTSIAVVSNNGIVTIVGDGTATITATTNDGGFTATCVVTTADPVTAVNLNKTTDILYVGDTVTLVATVSPATADPTVTWKSSNNSVATVNNSGVVTAVSAGTTIITATSSDGTKSASCTITVSDANTDVPDADVPQIVLTGTKTSADTTVTVDVSIANNPGFISLNLEIDYDPTYLTLTGITANNGVGATFTKAQSYTKVPYNFAWSSTDNVYYNGSLATLTFTVSADAPDGVYPITVSYYKGVNGSYTDGVDVNFDTDYNPLNLAYISGNIAVTGYTPGDADGNASINDRDATYMLRYLAGWNISDIVIDALDVDGSGTINDRDATLLLRYLAGWDIELK